MNYTPAHGGAPATATPLAPTRSLIAGAVAGLVLSACGGGGSDPSAMAGTSVSSAATTESASAVEVLPTFHMAPVTLDEPSRLDEDGHGSSAYAAPHTQTVPAGLEGISTARLTPEVLAAHVSRMRAQGTSSSAKPLTATVYTPAQIRAAYGLPALTDSAAALGAGQTIYIVDANDNPNAYADLNAFNSRFGLPACTNVAIAATAKLPLAAAPSSGCTFSKVYSTAAGGLTATAPAYNAGWAGEIALDVQWAHAMAPLARIVLIEANTAMTDQLTGAVRLANAMGPGVVSMSFGANEGSWTAGLDSTFTGTGMTYLAATGDSGSAVSWPAVSPNVLAVGGTSLTYTGSGARSESAWSSAGGGISAYTAMPSYQAGTAIAGEPATKKRAVADVSMNADPYTGQYVALTAPGQSAPTWGAYGGTSMSTPLWAGVLAVANAQRAASGKATLGLAQPLLYTQIAAAPSSYASAFADIASGANGSCPACTAAKGYDAPTGLGTPNVSSLLPLLMEGGAAANRSPVISGGALRGYTGAAFAATVSATDPDGDTLKYTMTGAPSGLVLSTAGALAWAKPLKGVYALKITATDPKGLSASGSYSLEIAAPNVAPTLAAATVNGSVGTALSSKLAATDANGDTLSFSMTGAPSGMSLSAAGVLSWASPVKGNYALTVTATDPGGLSAKATVTVVITQPNRAPTITAVNLSGTSAGGITGKVTASDPDGDALTFSLSGAPAGMTVVSTTGAINWPKPVKGAYSITVTAKDPKGLTGTAALKLTIG